jgi:flagellar biosynthetic protein FliR
MIGNLLSGTYTFALVLARFGGMIGVNPMFARRNVPTQVRTGLVVALTLLIAPTVELSRQIISSLDFAIVLLGELLAGVILGFVFQIFYYMLFFAGDLMDTQFGMAMAKVFDPGTNLQMSISSNFLNLLFMLYVLATNSHLVMLRLFAGSFSLVPAGQLSLSQEALSHIIELFIQVFSLSLRLALPFVAAEFILELSMGILMKMIPQIHVFVINIQLKVMLAYLLLIAFAGPIGSFIDNYIGFTLTSLQDFLTVMAT